MYGFSWHEVKTICPIFILAQKKVQFPCPSLASTVKQYKKMPRSDLSQKQVELTRN